MAGTKVIHGEATVQEKQGFSKATKALLDNQKNLRIRLAATVRQYGRTIKTYN